MTTLTYREQLFHPSWQRKRLECLEAADWRCIRCGAEDQTLHVHHKRYVKGRMVWEYESWELAVLCEDCHLMAHQLSDLILRVLCFGGHDSEPSAENLPSILALLFGYLWDKVDEGTAKQLANLEPSKSYWIGVAARNLVESSLTADDARKVAGLTFGHGLTTLMSSAELHQKLLAYEVDGI